MDKSLIDLLAQGVKKKIFPGAAAAVSWGSGSNRKRSIAVAGIKDNRYPDELIAKDTFFDLASLSKALSTTLIVYSLIEEKKLSLDDNLHSLFDREITKDKQPITVRQLLSHSSGLISYKPYFQRFAAEIKKENRELLLKQILLDQLEYEPETDCQYSDPGFILLGHLVEILTGNALDINFNERITIPLGLSKNIFYLPIAKSTVHSKMFAATEECPWRGRVIRAEVHDEHCWLMNGVCGHAGLFGNVEGVLSLCETILDQWQGRGKPCSWSGMLKQGLQKQYSNMSWCLGFDSPSEQGSSAGNYISAKSVGHLGYAGTSFWIDPEKEMVMVLLTNRVHPTRDNIKIRKFRPYFHDRIIKEFIKL
ncbi:MAG: serine hydrolase domain-containing protein [Thermodesulfobacteriota bacterium]|nr:serine hydrolase domain-containing protein [Thermodesulfobacteriota bacterium]